MRHPLVTGISYFFRQFIFWIVFFFLFRTLFLVFGLNMAGTVSFSDFIICQKYSLLMDIASFSYLTLLPALLASIRVFTESRIMQRLTDYYFYLLIIFNSLILTIDIALFREWGTKINSKAISYIAWPAEIFTSSITPFTVFTLFIAAVFAAFSIWVYRKFLRIKLSVFKPVWTAIFLPLLIFPLLLIGLRGGTQLFPINKSWCYHSTEPLLNHAAVNSFWNVMQNIFFPEDMTTNPYQFMKTEEARKLNSELMNSGTTHSVKVMNNESPNIVIILLESWSAEACGILFGNSKSTPVFDSLAHEGILLTRFYSTGFRTEQGLAAIVNAFPSQPKTTLIRRYGKFENLPSLAEELQKSGWHTSYICSGDITYANTKAYLENNGFDELIWEKDFQPGPRTTYGAYDEDLFAYHAERFQKQPFFTILVTSTSHEPFNANVPDVRSGNSLTDRYYNHIAYTDKCLGDYFERIRKKDWYKNTLFILVADHAHRMPLNRQTTNISRYWIPCLIFGEPLISEYKGIQIDKLADHTHLPATLLAQLDIDHSAFVRSRNIFDSLHEGHAVFTFDEGVGLIHPLGHYIWDNKSKQAITDPVFGPSSTNPHLEKLAKAFLQLLIDDYLDLEHGTRAPFKNTE